ncbi:MAG: hypothetical protein WA154_09880 [Moraxellaceae bacterium]
MTTALKFCSRVALVAAICVGLTLCKSVPATAAQLTREQMAAIGYNSTVTATTAMVKLERDTFGYAEFSYCFCSQPRSSLAAHVAMDSKASIHAIGVTYNDFI